jgi:hypothetical protein
MNFARHFPDRVVEARPFQKGKSPAERWCHRALSPIAVAAVIACLFLGMVVAAKATGHWQTNLQNEMYMDLVSHAREASHPGLE